MSDLKRSLSLKLLLGGVSGAIAIFAVAGPAQAQFFGSWGYMPFQYRMLPEMDDGPVYLPRRFRPIMSPGDIRMVLNEEGYQVVGGLRVNGRVYIANVRDWRGQGFRLVVDGMEGNILQRFALATPARPPDALARGSTGDETYFDPPRLPPPSVTQRAPRAEPARRHAAPPARSARRERPARTAAKPPGGSPSGGTPPAVTSSAVKPDGAAVASRPVPEQVTKVAPDDVRSSVAPTTTKPKPEVARREVTKPEVTKREVSKPEVSKPEAARPALVKPAEAKPAEAKPAAPVAEATRRPRIVYPDAVQKQQPAASAPASTAEPTRLKPTPPLSSVPVAPLE